MKTLLLAATSLLTSCLSIFAAEADIDGAVAGKWTMDFEAAQKVSAEKNLPVLINFSGSDWCHWCQLMEENVFTKPEWNAYSTSNLVMVLIDFPQDKSLVPEKYVDRNQALSTQYGVEGFPTFVLLDSDGKTELGKLKAGEDKTPASFKSEVEALLKNSASAQASFAESLAPEARKQYEEMMANLVDARTEIEKEEAVMVVAQQKIEELNSSILALEDDLREFRVAQLGEDEQKKFEKLKLQFDEKRDALMAWIQTQPERNAENQTKFETQQAELQDIAMKLQAY